MKSTLDFEDSRPHWILTCVSNEPRPSDWNLMNIQARTLFRFNRAGQITSVNEPKLRSGPRIFVGHSGGQRLVRTRQDIAEMDVRAWLACTDDAVLRSAVEHHAPVVAEHRGPAFVLPRIEHPGDAIAIGSRTAFHPELIARGWFMEETGPYVGIECDGMVVAVCHSSRLSDEAAEAGVETVAEYRGRGFALAAVRAWANAVQDSGRVALYSTGWTNDASRRVASKLGAHEFGEDWHLT